MGAVKEFVNPTAAVPRGLSLDESEISHTRESIDRIRHGTPATLAGTIALAAVTCCGYELHVNVSTAGFLYLLIVVVISVASGFWEATILSLVAATVLNYVFVPPVFTFTVADPQNWVALGVFEATALIVSRLSARVKSQAMSEARHRILLEKLYDFSHRILLLERQQNPGPALVSLIREVFQLKAVVLFDAVSARLDATGSSSKEMEDPARRTYFKNDLQQDTEDRVHRRTLRLGSKPIGAIVLSDGHLTPATADAIASLVGIALERARSLDAETRAEAARQSEELRAAVLDALGHAFKTPLTAIRAASSGLLETGQLNAQDAEMVALIDEESERLSQLASRLLQTARIDEAHLHRERVSSPRCSRASSRNFGHHCANTDCRSTIQPPASMAYADRELLAAGIRQLIDNAAKYSNPGYHRSLFPPRRSRRRLVVSVHNDGLLYPSGDRERNL